MDAQLPPALARRLQALGHEVEHVEDCELATAADSAIRDHAARTSAVIVTKDEDFAVHRTLRGGPAVVWIRIGNTRRAVLLDRMEKELGAIISALERGETLVEVL